MPKTEVTYNQLLALRDDIIYQQRRSASFFYFNKARVERFFNVNAMPLRLLETRMSEFVKKYVKHDENDQPCMEEKEGKQYFVFADADMEEKYKAAVKSFLAFKTTIDI